MSSQSSPGGASIRRRWPEIYGRKTGSCRGKGGSMHIADLAKGMLGANGQLDASTLDSVDTSTPTTCADSLFADAVKVVLLGEATGKTRINNAG